MKLRDLFRRKHIINLEDSTNLREKELIRKISRVGHLRLKLTGKSKFKLLDNLTFIPPTTTFELVDYPGHVMRARGLELVGEKKRDDQGFVESSAFFRMPNLWFDGYVSFESSQTAGHFIRLHGNELTLGRYDGSRIFKEECSFKMTRRDSSCGECSFANDWVEDEAGIGVVVSDSEDVSPGKDTKRLMVPASPPNVRKLPGLIAVDGPNRRQTVVRKDSEEYRRKKFVTFNQRNIIHEHVPVNWRHNNNGFDCSPLNSAREITEKEDCSYDGSASEESLGVDYKTLDAGRNVRRKMADTNLYDLRHLTQNNGLDIKTLVIKEENLEETELESEVDCRPEAGKNLEDDVSEISSCSCDTSTKESFSSSSRKCSCHDSCGLLGENPESIDVLDKVYRYNYNWQPPDGWQNINKENSEYDQRYEFSDVCNPKDQRLSNHEINEKDHYECQWISGIGQFDEMDCESLPKASPNINNRVRGNLSINEPSHQTTYNGSSESVNNGIVDKYNDNEFEMNCNQTEKTMQKRLPVSSEHSSDEEVNSINDVVLVCLSDDTHHKKDAILHLPQNGLLDSERDRSDSGLPLSPFVNDIAAKKSKEKGFFKDS